MKNLTGRLATVEGFVKVRRDRGKLWEQLHDDLIMSIVLVKHGSWDGKIQPQKPTFTNVSRTLLGLWSKRFTRKYLPGYKLAVAVGTKIRRTYRTAKWKWMDSKANHWLHTDGRRHLATLGGLLRTVNAYQSDLCYGGPEEGGWYYDHYSLVESRKCFVWNAEKVRDILNAKHNDINDENGRPYSSVLNGTELRVYIDNWKGEHVTRERPYYC